MLSLTHLMRLEMRIAMRRKGIWLLPLPIVLLLVSLFTGYEARLWYLDLIPLALSNVIILLLPLQAVYLAPAFTREASVRRDWFWHTPFPWTQAVAARAVVYILLMVALVTLVITAVLLGGILAQRWHWVQIRPLVLPLWSLVALAALSQTLVVCTLALFLRQSLIVAGLAITAVPVYFLSLVGRPGLTLLHG